MLVPYALHLGMFRSFAQEDILTDRGFQLQATLRENVVELRRVLGSIERPLSLRSLAEQISRRHRTKRIDFKTVERWVREVDPVEPDVGSIAVMAELAGVTFADFALGARSATERDAGPVARPGPDPDRRRGREAAPPTKRRRGTG
jgi:hypothetical protein